MALTPGARLGPYEVTGQIGAGGMGEVYKARDTRLDRTVGIKVIAADRRLMAAPVSTTASFQHGAPVPLFQTRISTFANPFRTSYAVARDGQRFLINTPAENTPTPSITVLVNWTGLLKK